MSKFGEFFKDLPKGKKESSEKYLKNVLQCYTNFQKALSKAEEKVNKYSDMVRNHNHDDADIYIEYVERDMSVLDNQLLELHKVIKTNPITLQREDHLDDFNDLYESIYITLRLNENILKISSMKNQFENAKKIEKEYWNKRCKEEIKIALYYEVQDFKEEENHEHKFCIFG